MAKEKEKTIDFFAEGSTVDEIGKTIEEKLKVFQKTFDVKGEEASREYAVYFGTGKGKGGIFGKGDTYDKAVNAAQENSPVELTQGYKQRIECIVTYKVSKEEEKKMKETSKGTPAGPKVIPEAKTYNIF